MNLRVATAADRGAVEALVRAAFDDDQDTLEILAWTWSSDARIPQLELVAEDGGAIVGHGLHSVAHVGRHRVAALAPLAVAPGRQGEGIGGALVREAVRRADALGFPLVALLGHPTYYPRFGFEPAIPLGIVPLGAGALAEPSAFMVRRLSAYEPSVRGPFRFAWEETATGTR